MNKTLEDIVFVKRLYKKFLPFADSQFSKKIMEEKSFHDRYFEMYLGNVFMSKGFTLTKCADEGPDLCIEEHTRPIWIEATCSSSGEGPNRVEDVYGELSSDHCIFYTPDAVGIILRIRNSLEEKLKKYRQWQRKNIIQSTDRYIIAINTGKITQCAGDNYPEFILQALFPIGDQRSVINQQTKDILENRFSYRKCVQKKTRVGIPQPIVMTNIFLDDNHSAISGIIYSHIDLHNRPNQLGGDFIFVHNPGAKQPIETGWLKVGKEYWVENGILKSTTWNK